MKSSLLMAGLLTCSLFAAAQDLEKQLPVKRCSSFEVYKQMLLSDPSFAKNQNDIESFTKNYVQSHASSRSVSAAGTVVYTIPVIVHVVYNTTAQNISDAQIQSQIDVLNKDYEALNTDIGKVPSVWTSLVADCQIKFCLATIDPNGAATTGIRRVHTTKTSFSTNNNVKYTSKGGDNAWPAASYLNLWVCKLGGGVLGYAQFPGGKAATDGVVITYTGFGTTGTAKSPYNLGRTATHEIGHWLNLRHIWGDDGTGCNGSDLVGDTPNQADEHYGCPAFPQVSCSNGPNGDMFVNYMDYTDDRCMYMFTNGQKDRMTATLVTGGSRHSVTISGKCGSGVAIARTTYTVNTTALSIAPNPTKGLSTISYVLGKTSAVQIVISDLYGHVFVNKNMGMQTAGNYKITPAEIASLNNGIYAVKLIADGEMLAASRIEVEK